MVILDQCNKCLYFHIFFGHKLACLCSHEMCINERRFQSDLKNICTGDWGRSKIGFIRRYPCPFLALRLQNREWIHYRGADIRIYIIKYWNPSWHLLQTLYMAHTVPHEQLYVHIMMDTKAYMEFQMIHVILRLSMKAIKHLKHTLNFNWQNTILYYEIL